MSNKRSAGSNHAQVIAELWDLLERTDGDYVSIWAVAQIIRAAGAGNADNINGGVR